MRSSGVGITKRRSPSTIPLRSWNRRWPEKRAVLLGGLYGRGYVSGALSNGVSGAVSIADDSLTAAVR